MTIVTISCYKKLSNSKQTMCQWQCSKHSYTKLTF